MRRVRRDDRLLDPTWKTDDRDLGAAVVVGEGQPLTGLGASDESGEGIEGVTRKLVATASKLVNTGIGRAPDGVGKMHCASRSEWGAVNMERSHHDRAACAATALTVLAAVGTAGCAAASTFGWVWANQPALPAYTPDAMHQYNSVGSTNTIARTGLGQYVVTFPRLSILVGRVPDGQTGFNDGNVQVTAQGAGAGFCKSDGWTTTTSGGTATVKISCYHGIHPADLPFIASYEDVNEAYPDVAYTYFDPGLPTDNMGLETAIPTRSSRITQIYTGDLELRSTEPPVSGFGMEHVTADGSGPSFCIFGMTYSRVMCFDLSSGTPQQRHVPFSYVKGLARVPGSGLRGAYGVDFIAPGDAFPTINAANQNSSFSSAPIVINRISTGLSGVTIPGAAAGGANAMVHVTAVDLSGQPAYCKPVTWNIQGTDVVVQVACFLMPGETAIDDGFQMSYVVPPA
jgi:hypothetical protein